MVGILSGSQLLKSRRRFSPFSAPAPTLGVGAPTPRTGVVAAYRLPLPGGRICHCGTSSGLVAIRFFLLDRIARMLEEINDLRQQNRSYLIRYERLSLVLPIAYREARRPRAGVPGLRFRGRIARRRIHRRAIFGGPNCLTADSPSSFILLPAKGL